MSTDNIPTKHKKAARSALNMLDYADCTEKKLREKLSRKGYDEDEVDFAVKYAKKVGYLNEERYLANAVYGIANSKLYGKRRLVAELYSKGFKREDIANIDFDEIDFVSNCAKRIEKIKNRYSDGRKLYAALMRYGFSPSEIKDAIRITEEENE